MIFVVGALIGVILGLTGAGGSVFAVPLLVYVSHYAPHDAIGVSLGAVGLSAFVGVISRLGSNTIAWTPALIFSSTGMLFSPLGNYFSSFVKGEVILFSFSMLTLVIAYRLWRQTINTPDSAQHLRASLSGSDSEQFHPVCMVVDGSIIAIRWPCTASLMFFGCLTGVLSGFFGVGGGFLIVPALLFLTVMPMATAVGTSLVVISLISGVAFTGYIIQNPSIPAEEFPMIAAGGTIGMLVGTLVARYVAGKQLQRFFAISMVIIAGITAFNEFDKLG